MDENAPRSMSEQWAGTRDAPTSKGPAVKGRPLTSDGGDARSATPKAVVLDTNALLLPFTSGIRLHEELERLMGPTRWLVASSVAWELERLGKGKDVTARCARMATKLVEQAAKVETSLPGDDGVLEVAKANDAAVVTNDRKLQQEAARRGLRVIVARTSGKLAFLGSGSSTT